MLSTGRGQSRTFSRSRRSDQTFRRHYLSDSFVGPSSPTRAARTMLTSSLAKITIAATVVGLVSASSSAAQTERRALSGDRLAIYNLAGKVRVQPGPASQVVVDVTRGGRDAGQ